MLDERQTRKVRVKRENVFYITRFVALIIFVASAFAIAQLETGDRWTILRVNIYLLIVMLWQWATMLATFVCRRLGLSLDGTTTEKVERIQYEGPATPIEEPFVIGRQGAQYIMPVCATLLCLICIGPSLFTRPQPLEPFNQTIFQALMFSLFAAIAICSWLNIRKPLVKVDTGGIAYCDSSGVTSRFIPWDKLASSDVVNVRNVFGEVIRQSVVLKDAQNKKLVTVCISSSSKEINAQNTEQFVSIIRGELTGAPSIPAVIEGNETGAEALSAGRSGWDSVSRHGRMTQIVRVERQVQVPVWNKVTKQKIIDYWSARHIVFNETSITTLRGKRGSFVDNLVSFNMINLMAELTVTVLSENEIHCVLEVNTIMQQITDWNRAWLDLEMETFETFLLHNDLQEEKWKRFGAGYNKAAWAWGLSCGLIHQKVPPAEEL